MSALWLPLITFIASVVLLYRLQKWITQHVQGIGLLLFDSYGAGMALLWLFLLPGIVVHEVSHLAMARFLGLKTGKFRFWPQLKGKNIILGSVEVQRSNSVLDSLVGLAPFLGGTLTLLVIGYWAFDAAALGQAFQARNWEQVLQELTRTLQVADSWLWLYLMAAVSNAMMPSPTDTESWRTVLIYLALVTAVLVLLGEWPTLSENTLQQLARGLQTLTYAFVLALIVDLAFAAGTWLVELGLSALRGSRVVYK